jgi:hypothetical protein
MCVIVYTKINGKKILAKNRDRTYKPDIEIVHEIVNGIEIAYIRDKITGWIEGINENGVGLVNSTLSGSDGKMGQKKSIIKSTTKKIRNMKQSKKKNVIYNALINTNSKKNFYDIIKHAKNNYILEGHTILFYNGEVFHIENNEKNNFVAEKVDKTVVFTNYGVNLKDEGYTKCSKGMSAFLRSRIIQNELKNNKIETVEELVNIMNRNYKNINPRFHPYRDKSLTLKKNKYIKPNELTVSTTGQIIFNMTDKELIYYADIHNSKEIDYINKLPREYTPKIRIKIEETEKKINPSKKIFTKRYLKKIEKRFECKTKKNTDKKSKKSHNNKTRSNRNK